MALDNFRTIELIWDKANKSIIKTIKTASSDTTGRYLSVKILDGGQEVTLNNAKLQLYWEHPNFNTSGTDDFNTVNSGGLFKMTFSKEMLTNIGELTAHLVLTLPDGKITSDGFVIEVIKGANDGVVVPTNGKGLVEQVANKIDKGNVTLNDLTQDVKLAMTGGSVAVVGENSVGTENLKDAAVTEDKTNFINSSANLFNKDTQHKVIGGYYSLDNLVEHANYNTYFVRVKPGMTITTSTNPVNTISFWDGSFNYLEYVSYSQTMSVPGNNNIAWVSIPVLTSLNVDEVMVVEGESLPKTYIPYLHTLSDYIGISSGALEPLLDIGVVSKNIFNKDTVRIGYEVNGNNSQVLPHVDSVVSPDINVEGMSNIYLSGLPTYNIGGASNLGYDRYYAFYDESGVPLAGSLGTIPRSATEQLVNVPDNAKEFAFTIYQRKLTSEPEDVSTIMVEEGRTKSRFEPYELGMVGIAGYKFKTGTTTDETLPTEGKVGLFFGDSITQTAVVSDDGVEYDEGRRSNWPKFAYDMLKLGDMWNYAQSGASFKDRSLEPRQYLGHQVDTAISNDRPADIIVVSCGTNDGAATIGDYGIAMSKSSLSELDVTNLYESIRYSFWKLRTHYPNATMYAALPIQRVAREQPQELIEAITKMAHRYNFIIIDGLRESGIVRDFETVGSNGRYLEDGLHPNVDGQIKMAKLYSRVIKNTYVE